MIYNNYDGIEIKKKVLYDPIIEYSLPDGYHFECMGISYGNRIYGTIHLDNAYFVKKDDENND